MLKLQKDETISLTFREKKIVPAKSQMQLQ